METQKQLAFLYLVEKGIIWADKEGRIYSNGKVLAPNLLPNGYYQYGISLGFGQVMMVYGQVASYLGHHKQVYNPALVIDHIDGDRVNNSPDNLRAITQKENLNSSWKRGFRGNGTRKRLTPDQKETAAALHKQGFSFVAIADKLGTTRQTVAKVLKPRNPAF